MTKPLTFAEIAANGALEVPEAIALVLAVAEESARSATEGQWRALPSAEDIVLSASGRVSLGTDNTSVAQPDHVKMLAGLLRSLLGVDDQMDRRPHTPGGLLVLIARATGTMDLPVPSYASFRGALLRFRSSDEPALSAIYWRSIAQRATTAQHAPWQSTSLPGH